ncbi:MAG: hypothetical protein KJ697_01730 [Nanoarchaeota archaeon]|nr:hypothetical protein [Nanoarchaeota archaeon]MBU4124534.1 hypothetical protein [Nanoarchaeota archaeon]
MIISSKVIFLNKKLEKEIGSLNENNPTRKAISKAVAELKTNAFTGVQLPKRLIPKYYIQKYKINNLWKYDMPGGWRLLYTVTKNNEIEIISAIIEWFDHKDYERRFNY